MFEDSLLISSGQRHTRGWAALVSVAVQALTVGTLIILPMIFTKALPPAQVREILPMPPLRQPPKAAIPSHARASNRAIFTEFIRVPASIPAVIADDLVPMSHTQADMDSGPPNLSSSGNVTGNSQINSLLNTGRQVMPTIQRSPQQRWKVSGGVENGLLLSDVKPIYPKLALAAGIQGEVVLQAVIGKNGRIENLRAVSGNALLIQAALDAVRRWRYRPFLLNGEPVEVETQITVRFSVS